MKIVRSGLRDLFETACSSTSIRSRNSPTSNDGGPARHYMMIDDKLRLLTAIKKVWGDRVTTVWVKQGHYATDPAVTAGLPRADVEIDAHRGLRATRPWQPASILRLKTAGLAGKTFSKTARFLKSWEEMSMSALSASKPWYRILYVQVLIAIVLGAILGWLAPEIAKNPWIELLGKAFVKLIKMAIAPIIFCTIVSGIAHVQEARSVGRVGLKALLYFEVVSTVALVIGLTIGLLWQPGASFPTRPLSDAEAASVKCYVDAAGKMTPIEYVLHIIPDSVVGAFVNSPDAGLCRPGSGTIFQIGDILQVLLFAVLFGFALMRLGERGHALRAMIDEAGQAMFQVIGIVMYAAPIGAFGAMAYTIGKFGTGALGNLLNLILTFYASAFLFILVVLGSIARVAGILDLQLPALHQG